MEARTTGTLARAAAAVGLATLACCGWSSGASGPCRIMVSSRPKDATVFVDGKERGLTPVTVEGLSTGKHEVRVVLEGYKPWTKTIQLRPGSRIVTATLTTAGDSAAGPVAPGTSPPREAPRDDPPGGTDKKKSDKPPSKVDAECPCCRGSGLIKSVGCAHCNAISRIGATICSNCQGKARMDYSCVACEGTGKITRGTKESDCRYCRGKGAPPCPICRGKGTVKRLNPAAASYKTTACISCEGDAYEKHLKCRKCGGLGTLRRSAERVGSSLGYEIRFDCPFCKGSGKAPDMCRRCGGRGSFGPKGPKRIVTPCMTCGGTGINFLPCRTCRGCGWHRSR
ncbi:MAG: PEGA domain-containing protein [Planctomycetota bacterium]|jgi:hypothetical protein